MRRRLTLVLVMLVALSLAVAAPATAKKPLGATTEHDFMAGYGIIRVVPVPQVLGWQGTITGDIEGCIEWWFDLDPGIVPTGQVTHYNETVEVHEGACPTEVGPATNEVILAADGSGTTTARHMKNSIWRTNGTVTHDEISGDESWLGRKVHESGRFEWDDDDPPNPLEGTSDFRIN
jgi:hypothetical protein